MEIRGHSDDSGLSFAFQDQIVLFSPIRLSSPSGFLVASVLTCSICLLERAITFLLTARYYPLRWENHASRFKLAAWRTGLYWLVTLLRLLYMLVSMTLNIGLILVIITSLSIGQLCIEYKDAPDLPSAGSPIRVKPSIYSPLPQHHPSHHHNSMSSHPYADDVEMVPTPPSSIGGSWLSGSTTNIRDKARQIMSGAGGGGSSAPFIRAPNSGGNTSAIRVNPSTMRPNQLSPIQSGTTSGMLSPRSAGRKVLFHVGGDSEQSDSD